MAKQTVNGVEIAYELLGSSGDPVVLVHGSLVDRRSWGSMASALAQSMQVVVYDRRGYGESGGAPGAHPVREDAADLAALLESIDVHPAHVVGHSYGGAVGLRLAIDRPELVRGLAVHEVPFIGLLADDPATAAAGSEMLAGARSLREEVRAGRRDAAAEQLVQLFSAEPGAWGRLSAPGRGEIVRSLDAWVAEYGDPDALRPDESGCRDLLLPVLLTTGSQSPRFLHGITRALADLLRSVTVVEISGAGHSPQFGRADAYVGILLSYLLERNVPVH
ncbi:MAG: alpha/beta fold hydrolase [Thermoplasmata archaeon]